ncbi:hypothetical protein [Pseudorhodoferax sp.]|uniref:hypothetical protein n=1 Tax=Pseudorhodoferax sp. TaxID=1993553 RepID=UPI0039E6C97F
MSHIDEWNRPVFRLRRTQPPTDPPLTAKRPDPAPEPPLAQRIAAGLAGLRPAPAIVHFYLGEGLRWIRIGYAEDVLLGPATAVQAGQAIAQCIAPGEPPLYFHALRPRDLLFFVEGGDPDGEGLPASAYGAPFDTVRDAWSAATPPAQAEARPATARRKAAARPGSEGVNESIAPTTGGGGPQA